MPLLPPAPSPGDQITPDARPRPLTPLPRSTQTKLRSTLLIPTLPHLLSELLHNSLDAGAGKIEIWIDPSKEGMSLRVEDDGYGMDLAGLKGIGQRWRSSKGGDWAGGVGYGPRGEALASIAALGLLEIITRPTGSVETYAKVIRTSKVLFEGASTRSLGRERGTTVLVRDLYLDIPIRQAALAATASTAVAACRKVLETLALVRHDVKWALWEETAVGSSLVGPKKIFSLHGAKSSVEVFRSLYGVAGVESVQSIRVTTGKKRVDGFISLKGSITKSHQHLYVNGYSLDRCELHSVITKRFAQSKFSVMTDDGTAEFTPSRSNRRSPRRLERYPVYVLNIQIPSAELDASYTPGKTVMGYKEEEGVKAFVLAVVEEFLRRHEFISTSVNGRRGEDTLATPGVRLDPARICASTAPMLKPRSATLSKSTKRLPAHTPELDVPHQRDSGSTAVCKPPDIRSGTPASVSKNPRLYAACQTPKRPYSTPILKDMLPPTTPLRRPQSALNCDVGSYRPPSCPVNAQPTGPVSTPATNRMLPPTTPSKHLASVLSGSRTARLGFAQSVRSGSGVGEKRKAGRAFTVDDSGRKRYKWIDEILADVDSGVLPFTPKAASLHYDSCTDKGDPPTIHPNAGFAYTLTSLEPYRPTSEITFSGSSLCSSRILGQMDAKFICAIIPSDSPTSDPTIVMIDQHAADERVSVEAILQDLCEGFMADSIPITELAEPLPAIILSRQEVTLLVQPGINDIFMRWGVELDLNLAYDSLKVGGSGYVQIPVRAVPTSLKSRLARKEASEMTRLVKLYLADLETEIGQVRALMSQTDEGQTGDWGQVLRWMPKEMLELANSKACRNAIMFGDHLTLDQCERLVHQLGKTRFPFMCAHGRPSMVPLTTIAGMADNGKRTIDWRAWQGTMR